MVISLEFHSGHSQHWIQNSLSGSGDLPRKNSVKRLMCPALPRLTLDPNLHPGNCFRTEEKCAPAQNVIKPYKAKPFAQGAPATQVILMLSQKMLPQIFVSTSR